MSATKRVHRTDIQVRFGDTDALGHVNNASFASFAELARLDFLTRFGGSVRSLILASLYIDFRRQVAFTDEVYVETVVEKLGTSSVTLAQNGVRERRASGRHAIDGRLFRLFEQ
jgi:acyl-CoA thioester hydrolase